MIKDLGGVLIGFIAGIIALMTVFMIIVPYHQHISIITEKKQCEDLGGDFATDTGYGSQGKYVVIDCMKDATTTIFHYSLDGKK